MARTEHLQLFGATDVGRRRPHNEDNFLVDRDLGLGIVADGMGGHAAGEVASALAVETIHEILRRNREPLLDRAERGPRSEVTPKQVLALIESAIQNASARIHAVAQEDPDKRGMGTTLSLVLVLDTMAYVAHVGDSRAYLIRAGIVRQLTEDHTMAAEMLRLGMVTADRLDKVPHRNAITRAVGIYPHVNVDTFTCEIVPGDQLLLATDGFTGYVRSPEELLPAAMMADGENAVRSCIDFANGSGGKDNITVVLMRIGRSEADDGVRARRLALKHEVLARVPLFCRLEPRELESIAGIATVGVYEPGEAVMREGEEGDELFVLLSGRLSVSRGDALLGELGPGEHLGEMGLIRTTPRSATVTAVVDSELVSINRRDFYEVIRTEPSVAVKLLWQFVLVLADRLEQTSQDLSVARRALAVPEPRTVPKARGIVLGGGAPVSATAPEADADADPFSSPPPASLGRFRLGYATLQPDVTVAEQRELAETLRDGMLRASPGARTEATPTQAAAHQSPAPPAAAAIPTAWQSMPVTDATLPGIGGPRLPPPPRDEGSAPGPPPLARRVTSALRETVPSAGVAIALPPPRPPPTNPPMAPPAPVPAPVPAPARVPAPATQTLGSPRAPAPPPPVPPMAPLPPPPVAPVSPMAPVGPVAPLGPPPVPPAPPDGGSPADDVRATLPLQPGRPVFAHSGTVSDAKTTPLRGQEQLRGEIDELRKEFKERLRKAREGGGSNESD